MKAELTRQWRLLDLQQLDTRLAQLEHRARTLPQIAELAAVSEQRDRAAEDEVLARVAVSDAERATGKAEADVEQVRVRTARDQERLAAGTGSAKDLQGLQHELETLARRQSELEDVELELMEQVESLRTDLERRAAAVAQLEGRLAELSAARDQELAAITAERETATGERANIAAGVGADLLALYERLRDQRGTGAAALVAKRCTGCGLELNASELMRIKAAAEDEVLRCEECGRILVRTAESGL